MISTKKQVKVRLFWGLCAVLAVAGLVYALLPKPITVDAARVVRGNLTVTVNHEGKTRIKERYVVSSPLAGKIKRIELRAGDPVTAGKTVITTVEPVDPALLDERSRMQAQARVKAADASLSRNKALLVRARTSQEFATIELERGQTLYQNKTLSHQELDNLEERKRNADEDVKSTEHAVQIAEYELDLARAALLRSSPEYRNSLEAWSLDILAPISGKVLRVQHEDATVIDVATPLIELGDPADLEMEVDVLSTDGVRIRPGARVVVDNWGGTQPLEGRVRLVEPAAFTKISALGVEEQRVNVIADFTGDPLQRAALGDAYRIEARIVVAELTNVLKAPLASLFKLGDRWALFCVEHGRTRLRTINVENSSQTEAAISGIDEDSIVVIYPSDRVTENKRVRVRRP